MLKLILKAVIFGAAAGAASTGWRTLARRQPPVPAVPTKEDDSHRRSIAVAQLARLDHDLRTPIGTIGNALEWLRAAHSDPQSAQEARDVIERQVGRLTTLTTELHQIVVFLGSNCDASSGSSPPQYR